MEDEILDKPEEAKNAMPEGDAKFLEKVPSGQAQAEKSGVEIAPKEVTTTRRNQVVPISKSTTALETSQEACPEERGKYQIDCSVIWTQIKQGEAVIPVRCSHRCYNFFAATWLLLANFFLFAGMLVLAPNMTEVAKDFNFTETERDVYIGGYVPVAFFTAGAPVALLIGYLTDRTVRRNLFVFIIIAGEIPCFCTIFTRSYWGLIITRAFTGVAIAGAEPLMLSMLSDMYDEQARAYAITCLAIGQGAGQMFGSQLAGFVGASLGWRAPFAIVSVPAIVVALIVLLFVNEPVRGAQEKPVLRKRISTRGKVKVKYEEKITLKKFCGVFTIKTNLLVYIAEAASCVPWGVLMTYMTDYLAQDRNFGVQVATALTAVIGVGMAIGGGVGGVSGQILTNRCSTRPWVPPAYVATCLLGSLPFFYWLLNANYFYAPDTSTLNATLNTTAQADVFVIPVLPFQKTQGGSVSSVGAVGCLGALLLSIPGANVRAWILNTNTPETRGTATSVINIVGNIGKGLGPLVASALIVATNRQQAFNISFACFLLTVAFYYGVCFTLSKDIKRVSDNVSRSKSLTRIRSVVKAALKFVHSTDS